MLLALVGIGSLMVSTFRYKDQDFQIGLRTSFLSAISRPAADPDPYFYDWSFRDLIFYISRFTLLFLNPIKNMFSK